MLDVVRWYVKNKDLEFENALLQWKLNSDGEVLGLFRFYGYAKLKWVSIRSCDL